MRTDSTRVLLQNSEFLQLYFVNKVVINLVLLTDFDKYNDTVALIERASRKISICLQTLKVGANDRSAQELQNGLYNEVHTKFLTKLWAFENVDTPI